MPALRGPGTARAQNYVFARVRSSPAMQQTSSSAAPGTGQDVHALRWPALAATGERVPELWRGVSRGADCAA
jgi:hypothetical protein